MMLAAYQELKRFIVFVLRYSLFARAPYLVDIEQALAKCATTWHVSVVPKRGLKESEGQYEERIAKSDERVPYN